LVAGELLCFRRGHVKRPCPDSLISYRREDSEGQAGRLFEGLNLRFRQDRVFIDVDSTEPGRDFRRTIEERVSSCAAISAVRLDGRWKGTVAYHWGPVIDETFSLRLVDGKVGSAGFLGHGHTILEGSLGGSSVRFNTRRMVTAGTSGRWEAVNHYAGAIDGDHIDMVLSIEDAASPHEPVAFRLSRVVDQKAANKAAHND